MWPLIHMNGIGCVEFSPRTRPSGHSSGWPVVRQQNQKKREGSVAVYRYKRSNRWSRAQRFSHRDWTPIFYHSERICRIKLVEWNYLNTEIFKIATFVLGGKNTKITMSSFFVPNKKTQGPSRKKLQIWDIFSLMMICRKKLFEFWNWQQPWAALFPTTWHRGKQFVEKKRKCLSDVLLRNRNDAKNYAKKHYDKKVSKALWRGILNYSYSCSQALAVWGVKAFHFAA